ncbi:MAG: PotD/PotF family extracellular solute-binding protein, partial [Pseudoflavonifractor sp.]
MKKAMKRTLALILTLAMALVLLTACGPKAPPAPSGSVAGGPDSSGEKQTLYVANWQAYCSDADYCEPVFEEMYNCNVEHVYYSSYEDLMTTLMTGGTGKIDCCVLSNNYTQMFREKGLLAEIDREKIPSYADILPEYKDLSPYAVDADKKLYSVPWCFGVTSLG